MRYKLKYRLKGTKIIGGRVFLSKEKMNAWKKEFGNEVTFPKRGRVKYGYSLRR